MDTENLKQFHLKWENYNHWKWAPSTGGFSSALWMIRSCCGPVFAIHKPYFVWCGVGATPKCRFTGNRREIKRSSRKNREERNLEENLCYEFREDKKGDTTAWLLFSNAEPCQQSSDDQGNYRIPTLNGFHTLTYPNNMVYKRTIYLV